MSPAKYRVRIFLRTLEQDAVARDLVSKAQSNGMAVTRKAYHWGQTLVEAGTDSEVVAQYLELVAKLSNAKSAEIEKI